MLSCEDKPRTCYVAGKKHRTVVIISDALRYGCGVELKEELDKNPTWTNTIQPILFRKAGRPASFSVWFMLCSFSFAGSGPRRP